MIGKTDDCGDAMSGYTKERSSILVIGLSIHTAPVEMREKLAIPEAEWPRAIEELCGLNHIEEAAVLSTCNRMEIYVVALSWHRGIAEVMEWMSKVTGCSIPSLLKREIFPVCCYVFSLCRPHFLNEILFLFCTPDKRDSCFRSQATSVFAS